MTWKRDKIHQDISRGIFSETDKAKNKGFRIVKGKFISYVKNKLGPRETYNI